MLAIAQESASQGLYGVTGDYLDANDEINLRGANEKPRLIG